MHWSPFSGSSHKSISTYLITLKIMVSYTVYYSFLALNHLVSNNFYKTYCAIQYSTTLGNFWLSWISAFMRSHSFRMHALTNTLMNLLVNSNCCCFAIITTRCHLEKNCPFLIEKFLEARLKLDYAPHSLIVFGYSFSLKKVSISLSSKWFFSFFSVISI